MAYNLVKLLVVAVLVVVVIVAMGLDWLGDDLARFILGLLIGWIVRDVTGDRPAQQLLNRGDE